MSIKSLYTYKKRIAAFLLVLIGSEIVAPLSAYALTGGPSQPEVQSFEPANTNQMVDPFTGDFVYNLPLMEVGSYPINLSYHSGITMDQEASWVGLGWNVNMGVINRNMRGLPDDFNGDEILKEYNIRTNWTAGVDLGFNAEFAGFGLGAGMGVYYNNYRGVGFRASTSFAFTYSSDGNKGKNTASISPSVSLGLSMDSQEGIGVSPGLGLGVAGDGVSSDANVGFNYNSREGFKGLTYGVNVSMGGKKHERDENKKLHKESSKSLFNGGSSISFASQSMCPNTGFAMENFSFTGKIKVGGELPNVVLKLSGSIGGSYSQQKLATRRQTVNGYGYLYLDRAAMNPTALLDFNREKDQPFRIANSQSGDEGSPVLSLASYQYDLLSVSGQGIGGQYRAKRGDVGIVYDRRVDDFAASGTVNIDIGLGLYAAIGGDVNLTLVNTTTSGWTNGNELTDFLRFQGYDNTLYEPAYFTNIGEKTINDQAFYDRFGDTDPIRAKIGGIWLDKKVKKKFERYRNGLKTGEITPSANKKKEREKRNQAISFITAGESIMALDKDISDYPYNSYPISHCGNESGDINKIKRLIHSNYKRDHITEISVLGTDGKRYVYGIPAYNRQQREVTFSVSHPADMTAATSTGLVQYHPEQNDNTIDNQKGMEHYFSSENIPDYAHSYLLTAVLSPDYIDLTGDGISDDDYGDAVRINYTRMYGANDNDNNGALYQWRVPYKTNSANYQQGYKSNIMDDKASYSYGKKEIWYVNSIESKTMVAVFRLSDRLDGLGVMSEAGGKNPDSKLKKLDRIDLYSKPDLQKNGANAIPVKSANFGYSYKLCPGIDNSASNLGKLTLDTVWFTYQRNNKGKLNPYIFHYDSYNPPYHIKHYDRWGNFQNNTIAGVNVPETEFPYTIQKAATADKNATAWSLTSIDLPTGGKIQVDMEADRYAYVQDKRAMQMYQIYGLGQTKNATNRNLLYNSTNYSDNSIHNNYVYIKVNQPIPVSGNEESKKFIRQHYMDGITNLYFNVAVKMYPNHSPDIAEYVSNYCLMDSFGLCPGQTDIIWLKLKPEPINNSGTPVANPIAKTAWQFIRLNLPALAYPGSSSLSDGSTNFMDVIRALVGPILDIQNMIIGFNKSCISRKWCMEIIPEKSWIRLNVGNYSKLGGGSRVKKVTISDNWTKMVSDHTTTNAVYGQVYDYTMKDDKTGDIVSSGVAEYEPMVGGNENPLHQPLKYNQSTPMAPHNAFFIEFPIGESLYPAPGVGYRQVKVTSYGSSLVSAKKGTGYTIHKFYTAYDFPVITGYTPSGPDAFNYDKSPSIATLFSFPSMTYFKGTQGFMVELNDMHGKPKSEETYDNDSSLISGTEYSYIAENTSAGQKQLKNEVPVMTDNGKITRAFVGKEIEVMFDSREQNTTVSNVGAMIQVDVDGFTVPFPIPIPIPTILPAFSEQQTKFNSITSTKVVRRYGILDKITARQYGSSVSTKNMVWDAETGDVLLTQTQNEFDDPIYNFTYPSHFAYEGMQPAYKNVGAVFKKVTVVSGALPTGIESYFTAGDEILVTKSISDHYGNIQYQDQKAWIIDKHSTSSESRIVLIDETGHPVSASGVQLKIVRSGHRNMQSLPIATLTSLNSPVLNDTLLPTIDTKIINTSATEYSEQWKVNSEKVLTQACNAVCPPMSCDCINNILSWVAQNRKFSISYSEKVRLDSIFGKCECKRYENSVNYYKNNSIYSLTPDSMLRSDHPYQLVMGRCTLNIEMVSPRLLMGYRSGSLYSIYSDTASSVKNNICSIANGETVYGYILDSLTHKPLKIKMYLECNNTECYTYCASTDSNQVVNPYRLGLLGNWRPYKQWVYRDFRTPPAIGTTNIRQDGIYKDYQKFWGFSPQQKKFTGTASSKYVTAATLTKYNTNGAEIENKDAANIYSAVVYGYLQTQPVAVAKNARYKQIGFDGFEDYDFTTDCDNPCRTDHFSFSNVVDSSSSAAANGVIDNTNAHSGNRSVKVTGVLTMTREIKGDNDNNPVVAFNETESAYHITSAANLPKFSPDAGRYFISAWIKEGQVCTTPQGYINNKIIVSFIGASGSSSFAPSGNIIDGWQRVEGVFTIPSSALGINIQLQALNGATVYFDDIRVQPFNSSMKTYVYDNRSLRFVAELDENNYATFYEYNDLGELIRIKKETARGIMTIQETQSVLKKR